MCPASRNRAGVAQTLFRGSGGFGPISLPLLRGLGRPAKALVSLTVSMVLLSSEKADHAPVSNRRSDERLVLGRNGRKAVDGGKTAS